MIGDLPAFVPAHGERRAQLFREIGDAAPLLVVGSEAARGLGAKLDEAERMPQEGFQGLPDCDERMKA